jgi:hypothetical protein
MGPQDHAQERCRHGDPERGNTPIQGETEGGTSMMGRMSLRPYLRRCGTDLGRSSHYPSPWGSTPVNAGTAGEAQRCSSLWCHHIWRDLAKRTRKLETKCEVGLERGLLNYHSLQDGEHTSTGRRVDDLRTSLAVDELRRLCPE